jgi:light-harvesting complex I chlorophyll a/b binding protein 1
MSANRVKDVMAGMKSAEKALVVKAASEVQVNAKEFLKAGQIAPTGFFDPAGFAAKVDGSKLLFYREAELKHGRVCMLATLGVIVGEKFHTFFPGIDVPAAKLLDFNFQEGSLQNLWYAAFLVLGLHEIVFDILGGKGAVPKAPSYTPEEGTLPGDLGFDPLNLKPSDPAKLIVMQNKELSNGRLAMLSFAGMLAQELVTGKKIF